MTEAEQLKAAHVVLNQIAAGCPDPGLAANLFMSAVAADEARPNPSGDADVRESEARHTARGILSTNFDFLAPDLEPSEQAEFENSITNAILALTGNASTDRAGTPASPDAEKLKEWTPWAGGKNPLEAHVRVEVRYRTGKVSNTRPSCHNDWKHIGVPGDIVAYRVIAGENRHD